jgi:predicted TPR repeat methyltransferase
MSSAPPTGADWDVAAEYDLFAEFYDRFTGHHNYEDWVATLENVARRAGLSGHRLLDVACGTGKSTEPWLRRGYSAVASDISEGMLAHARQRLGPDIGLERLDMRELPRLGEFDLVTCLDDAVNNLEDSADLRATFAGVQRNLAPSGMFVFDVNSLATFRFGYSELHVWQGDGWVGTLEGSNSSDLPAGGSAEFSIEGLLQQDGRWRRVRTIHRHRHHPPATIRQALADAGLGCAQCYGMLMTGELFDEADDLEHTKLIYLAVNTEAVAELRPPTRAE